MCIYNIQTLGEFFLNINKKVVILHNLITKNSAEDEWDNIIQAKEIETVLKELGFNVLLFPFSFDINAIRDNLKQIEPLFVFNLVESIEGDGRFIYMVPSLLEHLNIDYTGCNSQAIFLTTNKILTKKQLSYSNIDTPVWVSLDEDTGFISGQKYIIKEISEDASIGIDDNCLIRPLNKFEILEELKARKENTNRNYFAEYYIEGREFNVSILEENNKPVILPISEIKFINYTENNKEKILDYRAKWIENSFEYINTQPVYDFEEEEDIDILNKLKNISLKCWKSLGLKGYARVDFRIDKNGTPYVLEINANPCLTPSGSGFINSAKRAGYEFKDIIKIIITG
jgi:D-alanine-D-alanine ligase